MVKSRSGWTWLKKHFFQCSFLVNRLFGEQVARPYKTIQFYSSKNALCNGAIDRGEGSRKTDQQGRGKKTNCPLELLRCQGVGLSASWDPCGHCLLVHIDQCRICRIMNNDGSFVHVVFVRPKLQSLFYITNNYTMLLLCPWMVLRSPLRFIQVHVSLWSQGNSWHPSRFRVSNQPAKIDDIMAVHAKDLATPQVKIWFMQRRAWTKHPAGAIRFSIWGVAVDF